MSVNGSNIYESWRADPLYTIPEAARLAHVSTPTVRRWLFGYETTAHQMRPVFGEQTEETKGTALVSFLQLVEIVVASGFRRRNVKLERIRRAHGFAKNEWTTDYPFASLNLETLGGHVLRRFEESEPGASLRALDLPEQWTLPGLVLKTIQNFDYEVKLAARWFPVGKDVPIVIDPRWSAGMPTIPDRRVTIETIHKRFTAGYSIQFIADDLRVDQAHIEEAVRYAGKVAA